MGGKVDGIARQQLGLVTRAQAVAAGIAEQTLDDWLRRGRWAVVHSGVYRVEGAPQSWKQELLAATLWAGPGSLVSHRAAGALWRLDGVGGHPIEVTVPITRRRESTAVVVHQSRDLVPGDGKNVDGIPVTSLARTLIDLASVLDSESLELALEDATRRRRSFIPWLADRLARTGNGHRGTGYLSELVKRRLRTPSLDESPLETRLRIFLHRHGHTDVRQQFRLYDGGRFVARIDFAYPGLRYGIETDGRRSHDTRRAFEDDRRRWNEITGQGWTLMVVTWRALLDRPQQVLTDFRRGLEVARARHPDKATTPIRDPQQICLFPALPQTPSRAARGGRPALP